MSAARNLLQSKMSVINIGLESFAQNLESAGVTAVQVDWRPPAQGDPALAKTLAAVDAHTDKIAAANREAISRVLDARPVLVDIGLAGKVIPAFTPTTILHAGPPVTWEKMCGPVRGAVIGALIYEGLAKDASQAVALAQSGEIQFAPCHHLGAVGPMAGVVSASMPVFVVENRTAGNRAYSTFNEGLGKVLRFGAYAREVLDRLRWLRDTLAPALCEAIWEMDGIDLKTITAKALQMGDEAHNRNFAATSLLVREILPALARVVTGNDRLAEIGQFLAGNDHFFLNLSMAACKASLDAGHGIPWSTLVTAMARNGTEFGIRVSGLGDRWFTAPAPMVDGLYFPGFSDTDANPDLGDSAITETCGLGGFAMAAAPAIVQFVGGTVADALSYTNEMYEITLERNPSYTIPNLDFQGTPTGIEILKVVETGIAPIINTGIAHREAGVGQVGAGIVRAPMECFVGAVKALAEEAEEMEE